MSGSERIQVLSEETSIILETLKDGEKTELEKLEIIKNHIKLAYTFDGAGKLRHANNLMNLEFDCNCEWINTVNPPNLPVVSSKSIIIVEFFTHCCINCIHSIEDFRQAHDKIMLQRKQLKTSEDKKCGLKVISIHSPKFPREKNADSIRDFVERMQMSYTDVVNDPNCTLWGEWQIFCWPTILIFGPSRHQTSANGLNLLFALMGEGHGKSIEYLVSTALEFFDGIIDFTREPTFSPPDSLVSLNKVLNPAGVSPAAFLKYPGKVKVFGNIIVIADSGNNRLIISDTDGNVQDVIGGTERGYLDGNFHTVRFYNPQGIAFRNDYEFFVADTGNHAVRMVNLKTKTVSSLITPNCAAQGENDVAIHLKSPWDLAFYGTEVLLIAAAGNHQILGYFFEDLQLFRVSHLKNSFDLIAGSGKEENRNNIYPLRSAFAQPSGIAVSYGINEDDKTIFIADAESSSIRYLNYAGKVSHLVGGSKDPSDLFAFGDIDSCSYDVKLQHPMGVCSGVGTTKIFIVDTYNHKIKMIDLETKHCTTLIGDGTAGNRTGAFTGYVVPKRRQSQNTAKNEIEQVPIALFNEPGGISINDTLGLLYIADTNNHSIKVANIGTKLVAELVLRIDSIDSKPLVQSNSAKSLEMFDQVFEMQIPTSFSSQFEIKLHIHKLPTGFEGGSWKAISRKTNKPLKGGSMERSSDDKFATACVNELTLEIISEISYLMVDVYLCGEMTCYRKTFKIALRIQECSTDALDNSVFKSPEFNFYPSANALKE